MSKICPMCGAFMKTNICEYCRYEMEIPEEEVQTESENEERTIYIQPKIIINAHFESDESEDTYEETSEDTYEETVETVSRKSRIIASLLCFFFGAFGFHYFYVGKKEVGTIYFFTIGLLGIGWFFDCIRVPLGFFKDKDGYRVRKFF